MDAAAELIHFENDGIRLAGERWPGDPDGDIVILLHGGGQTRHSWKRTAERLSRGGRTAIALDARGHGDSGWHPEGRYRLGGFVSDLLAFVATLERRPILVGASLGGITALVAAGEHPGVARAIVLVDIVARPEQAGRQRIRAFMTGHHDGFASLQDVADAIAQYNPVRQRPKSLDGLRKNVRQHEDGRWYWHWDPAFMRITDEAQREASAERLSAAAAHVDVPTLIVRGLQSDMVTPEGVREMIDLIPLARAVEVGAAGHMVAGDDNDIFTTSLEAFLDSLPPEVPPNGSTDPPADEGAP